MVLNSIIPEEIKNVTKMPSPSHFINLEERRKCVERDTLRDRFSATKLRDWYEKFARVDLRTAFAYVGEKELLSWRSILLFSKALATPL
jgi:hypothetical protein